VTDMFAHQFRNGEPDPKERYIVKGSVRLRSGKVDQVRRASRRRSGEARGRAGRELPAGRAILLHEAQRYTAGYAGRGDQECEGEQFALDSHRQLGKIRRANQGVFEIMGRDTAGEAASTAGEAAPTAGEAAPTDGQASISKKVRLVSTVDYYLIN